VIPSIKTARLELVSLSPAFLRASLSGDAAAAAALLSAELPIDWPKRHEPLMHRRLAQLEANPADQAWLLRAIVLGRLAEAKKLPSGQVGPAVAKVLPLIGLIGFHAPPDETGMLEIGYRTEPPYREHGYATEAVQALLSWASCCQEVKRFRASIGPTNEPSLRLIKKLGFQQTGQQWDEVDGLELVFERHAVIPRPYTSDEDTT
jgi:RimJ/RimL family protein N-acetyltransferase